MVISHKVIPMSPSMPAPDYGQVTWVKVEIALDINGRPAQYVIEGHPVTGEAIHIHLDPVYEGSPVAVLGSIKIDLDCNLDECTLQITNEPPPPEPPRLTIVKDTDADEHD